MSINDLSSEVIYTHILPYLDAESLTNFSDTSQRMKSIVNATLFTRRYQFQPFISQVSEFRDTLSIPTLEEVFKQSHPLLSLLFPISDKTRYLSKFLAEYLPTSTIIVEITSDPLFRYFSPQPYLGEIRSKNGEIFTFIGSMNKKDIWMLNDKDGLLFLSTEIFTVSYLESKSSLFTVLEIKELYKQIIWSKKIVEIFSLDDFYSLMNVSSPPPSSIILIDDKRSEEVVYKPIPLSDSTLSSYLTSLTKVAKRIKIIKEGNNTIRIYKKVFEIRNNYYDLIETAELGEGVDYSSLVDMLYTYLVSTNEEHLFDDLRPSPYLQPYNIGNWEKYIGDGIHVMYDLEHIYLDE